MENTVRHLLKHVAEMPPEDMSIILESAGVDVRRLEHVVSKFRASQSDLEAARASAYAKIIAARGLSPREAKLKQFRFQVYEDLKLFQKTFLEDEKSVLTYNEMVQYVKTTHKMKVTAVDLQRMMVCLDAERAEEQRVEIEALAQNRNASQLSTILRNKLNLHLPPSELVRLKFVESSDLPPRKKRKSKGDPEESTE